MKIIQLTQGKTTIVDDEDYLIYGHLKWHVSHGRAVRRNRPAPDRVGAIWLHREIMGNPHGVTVDHINGNPLDNRKTNLRLCTTRENMANQRKWTKPTSSKYKGVYYAPRNRNHWQAYIGSARAGGRQNLGSFATETEAGLAYNKAAVELYGDFAHLNELC